MKVRPCKEDDVDCVRQLVSKCKPLGLYSAYCYWVSFRNLGNRCFILEDDGNAVGYVSGLRSSVRPDIFFLWQLGVLEDYRGRGHAAALIGKIIEVARDQGCKSLQFTMLQDNESSYRAFASFARKNGFEMRQVGQLDLFDSLSERKLEDPIYEFRL